MNNRKAREIKRLSKVGQYRNNKKMYLMLNKTGRKLFLRKLKDVRNEN